ncbi:MAG: NADP-dependent malic enzyme [Gemmatimonadota bacterium]|nr:NADP-dependent malic enzyme [Gemmatimonadota bacterium]
MKIRKKDVLEYHSRARTGKVQVVPTKPCSSQRDLSLAYTPGVALPCLEIQHRQDDSFLYTARGNLVAVVSNGTAVLGLGAIGAAASKPVMEGKGVLFKRFADIDVFDLELDTTDPDEVIRTVKLLEPTFGGINLEDIKAPECFYIEEKLKEICRIPVFHDDQHGTAIIAGAALINALMLTGRKLKQTRIVICGAGAAGIACAELLLEMGASKKKIILCDSRGVIYAGRTAGMNPYKQRHACKTDCRTLEDAMAGADVFIGVSGKDILTDKMVLVMAPKPVIFALANPDPEIPYDRARRLRPDSIVATGRSDFPNQVNNVLGFPYIFRGALDVRASAIDVSMKLAAVEALAQLAREDVPDKVRHAYAVEDMHFGPEYIIPKPFDPRVLLRVAPAVARAAMESGLARVNLDLEEYVNRLENTLDRSRQMVRYINRKARTVQKRIVLAEADQDKILRASQIVLDMGLAKPVLLGEKRKIMDQARKLDLDLKGITVVNPATYKRRKALLKRLIELRWREGVTPSRAEDMLDDPAYFAALMVEAGDADGMVAGLTQHYPYFLRPALQIIRTRPGISRVSGLYMVLTDRQVFFFADTTVNIDPDAEQLAEIAVCAAETARRYGFEPRVAMLSFSNFGSNRHPFAKKVRRATDLARKMRPEFLFEGEMQADTAVNPVKMAESFPWSRLKTEANVLIFPDLQSGNIAYKLLRHLGGATTIGPVLMGMRKPVHVLQRGDDVEDIVRMIAICAVDAQENEF